MNKFFYILYTFIATLIFASCKDENAFMPGDDGLTCYSILVSAPNNATRATYKEDGENIAVVWEKGDVIYVGTNQFVYKEDRENNTALFVLYGELQGMDRSVKFGEDENGTQIQSKNNKCHEVLVGDATGYNFTNPTTAISLQPKSEKSLLHIQAKSPAMFMGKSLLKVNGLATEDYTIQLGTDPSLVFADKNEQLDIYVTVPVGSISSGKTLKFYFYAYDENTPTDLTHGDEYHYYMKCNAQVSIENNEVVKLPLPNKPTHVAIQMGLKVKWATTNVGATSDQPGEASFGGYYPWGMVEEDYQMAWDPDNHASPLFGLDINGLKGAFGDEFDINKGFQGLSSKSYKGKTIGDPVSYCWGDDWATPTNAEMEELKNCASEPVFTGWVEWSNTSNVISHIKTNGRYFKGKGIYANKKIWLPAAGGVHYNRKGTNDSPASNDGCNGIYMTSTMVRQDERYGFNLMSFHNTAIGLGSWASSNKTNYNFNRNHGVSVRPIRRK